MATHRPHRKKRGFTLIEVLVALGIFSIAALALLNVQGEGAIASSAIRDRTMAAIVAENRLIESFVTPQTPIVGLRSGETKMAGDNWVWSEEISPTSVSGVSQITVSVRRKGENTVLSEVTLFRGEK